jgi:hypothetical protein
MDVTTFGVGAFLLFTISFSLILHKYNSIDRD